MWSQTSGPPPPGRPGGFQAPPRGQYSGNNNFQRQNQVPAAASYDDDDDDDGALGATINLVTSAASMFFKPPQASPAPAPAPVAVTTPNIRGPPAPIQTATSMLDTVAPPARPSSRPPTPTRATQASNWVPSSPLAHSSPRVVVSATSPRSQPVIPQIPVPSLDSFPPAVSTPTLAMPSLSASPMIPPMPSAVPQAAAPSNTAGSFFAASAPSTPASSTVTPTATPASQVFGAPTVPPPAESSAMATSFFGGSAPPTPASAVPPATPASHVSESAPATPAMQTVSTTPVEATTAGDFFGASAPAAVAQASNMPTIETPAKASDASATETQTMQQVTQQVIDPKPVRSGKPPLARSTPPPSPKVTERVSERVPSSPSTPLRSNSQGNTQTGTFSATTKRSLPLPGKRSFPTPKARLRGPPPKSNPSPRTKTGKSKFRLPPPRKNRITPIQTSFSSSSPRSAVSPGSVNSSAPATPIESAKTSSTLTVTVPPRVEVAPTPEPVPVDKATPPAATPMESSVTNAPPQLPAMEHPPTISAASTTSQEPTKEPVVAEPTPEAELAEPTPEPVQPDAVPSAKETPKVPLPPEWTEVIDPMSGRPYYYNTVTQETAWERPAAPEPKPSQEMTPQVPQVEDPNSTSATVSPDDDKQSAEAPNANESDNAPLPPNWIDTVDPASGRLYYYNTVTQETSWERPSVAVEEATPATTAEAEQAIDETFALLNAEFEMDQDEKAVPAGTETETSPVKIKEEPPEPEPTPTEEEQVPQVQDMVVPLQEEEDDEMPKDWAEVVDPNTGNVYYYNTVTQETSWEKPKVPKPPSTMELLQEDLVTEQEKEKENLDTQETEPVQVKEEEEEEVPLVEDKPAPPLETDSGLAKDWEEVVDPNTGNVYYYNTVTQETSWEKPAVPKPPSTMELLQEDLVGEEATPELALENVNAETERVDADKEDEDSSENKVEDDEESSSESETERSENDPMNADGDHASAETSLVEDAEYEWPEGSDSDEDGEAKADNAETSDWVETVDPTSGKTYYYNTVTQETAWEAPAGFAAAPKPTETQVETSGGDQDSTQESSSPQAPQTTSLDQNKDSPLPEGWLAQEDPSSGTTYYYNTITQETSWERPTGGDQPDDSNEGQAAETTIDEIARIQGLESTPDQNQGESQDLLPPNWVEEFDPTTNAKYYVNSVTQETSWERPTGTAEPIPSEGQNDTSEPDQEPHVQSPAMGTDVATESLPTDVAPPLESSNEELPSGWTEVYDSVTEKVYYYNAVTQETSWEKPEQSQATEETPIDESEVADDIPKQEISTDDLPEPWVGVNDEATGKIYYYNSETQEVSWTKPTKSENSTSEMQATAEPPSETLKSTSTELEEKSEDIVLPPLPHNWTEKVDESTGKTYYYYKVTGKISWERPSSSPGGEVPSKTTEAPPILSKPVMDKTYGGGEVVAAEEPDVATTADSSDHPDAIMSSEETTAESKPPSSDATDIGTKLPEPVTNDLSYPWVEVNDPSSGKPYYYNEVTEETSWEKPETDESNNDAATPITPLEDDAIPTRTPPGVNGVQEEDPDADSHLPDGWVEISDPASGKVYYYNESTGETSWEKPEAAGEEAAVPAPEEIATESPEEVAVVNDVPAAAEDESAPPLAAAGDDDGLPDGWVETSDPASGQVYYYNESTGETSWEKPEAAGEEAAVPAPEEIATESPEEDIVDDVPGEAEDESAPALAAADDDDGLPDGWVETGDPASGQVYYYNESTGETSWEKPGAAREDAAVAAPEQIATESPEEVAVVNDVPTAVEDESAPPLTAAGLPDGWVETGDPASGQVYYYNESTGETSWEKPGAAREDAAVAAPEEIATESPEEAIVDDAPGATEDESASPLAAADGDDRLPDGWVETGDPTSGQVYYYNESTGETSWEKPGVAGEEPVAVAPEETAPEEVAAVDEVSEAVADESAQPLAAAGDDDGLPDGWVETGDPGSGQVYYYNESTGETSWEKPGLDAASMNVNEAEGYPPVVDTHENSTLQASSAMDEVATNGVNENENNSNLPAGWVETCDPSTGDPYYFNEETGETSWEKPASPAANTETDVEPQQTIEGDEPPRAKSKVDQDLDIDVLPELNDVPEFILPEFWTQASDEDSGKTYYFNSLTQKTSWDPPEGSKPNPERQEMIGKLRGEKDTSQATPPSNDDEVERPETAIDDTTATNEVEKGGDSGPIASGWTEVVDPQTGETYYHNERTGETSWEPPVSGELVEEKTEDKPTTLATAWEEVVDEASGDVYFFNPETEETTWERPKDIPEPLAAPVEDVGVSSKQENEFTSESADKASDNSAEDPLPDGWVLLTDPDSGKEYYLNEIDNTSSWVKPKLPSASIGSETNVRSHEIIGSTGEEKNDLADVDDDGSMLEGWVEVVDPQSGDTYYYNESTNETKWDRPSKGADQVPFDKGSADHLPAGWVEVIDQTSGEPYYFNEASNETSWERPTSSQNLENTATLDNEDVVAQDFFSRLLSKEDTLAYSKQDNSFRNQISQVDAERTEAGFSIFLDAPRASASAYIDKMAKSSKGDLLWKLISVASRTKGRLRSEDGVAKPQSPESAIVKILLGDGEKSTAPMRPKGEYVVQNENDASSEGGAEEKLQSLLLHGKRREAVEEAIACHDYATALFVGSMCDPETYKRATTAFTENAFRSGTPMHTVARLFSGGAVAPNGVQWGVSATELRASWKKHLAGIVSNRIPGWDSIVLSLGDRLKEINEIAGAHFCYMVCGCPVSSAVAEGTRICLLGCDHTINRERMLTSADAVQAFDRTEAYEWTKRLGNKKVVFRSFLPLKVIFAVHMLDSGLEEQAKVYVKSIRVLFGNTRKNGTLSSSSISEVCNGGDAFLSVLQKLEEKLGCSVAAEPDSKPQLSEPAKIQMWQQVNEAERPTGRIPNEILNPEAETPSALDQSMGLDATFLSAKSNLMDVTGYTLDSPDKSTEQIIASPQPKVPPIAESPMPLSKPPLVPTSKPVGNGSSKSMTMPPKPDRQGGVPPSAAVTPVASSKPRAAPSTAPSALMGKKKDTGKKGREQAPSSSEKKGGWSIRQRLVKWINPDATEVTLPDSEEKAYYDEKRKVWVFPGDDPDDLVKPIAPPPTMTPAAPKEPATEADTPKDPLAAMMAPPSRGPSSLNRTRKPGTPMGYPGMMPGMATPGGMASPMPGGAPPKFAVFQPKATKEEKTEE